MIHTQADSLSMNAMKLPSLHLPPSSSRRLPVECETEFPECDDDVSLDSPAAGSIAVRFLQRSPSPTSPFQTPPSFSTDAIRTHDSASLVLSTNFSSHLRTSFSRAPTDHTGELIRLLDDISTVTHCITAYAARQNVSYQSQGDDGLFDGLEATRHFYKSLCHDGYACLILEANTEMPLTFPETAPHGLYVVTLSALDVPPAFAVATRKRRSQQSVLSGDVGDVGERNDLDDLKGDDCDFACGTMFAVFRRQSSPSVPGRLADLQQTMNEQVAAGYVIYSSTTRLVYTLGEGVFSFSLHPVASQYFMHPTHPLIMHHPTLNESNHSDRSFDNYSNSTANKTIHVFVDYSQLRQRQDAISRVLARFIQKRRARVFFDGCLAADFDSALRCGGVILWFDVHLLCAAAGMAFIVEQSEGKATNGYGKRILGMSLHVIISFMFTYIYKYFSCTVIMTREKADN